MNYEVFQLTRVGSLSGLVWEPSPLLSNSFGWIFPQAQIFSSDAHTDQYFDEYLRWILLALHNFLFVFLTSNLSRTIDVFSALVSLTVNFRFSTQRQHRDLWRSPSLGTSPVLILRTTEKYEAFHPSCQYPLRPWFPDNPFCSYFIIWVSSSFLTWESPMGRI